MPVPKIAFAALLHPPQGSSFTRKWLFAGNVGAQILALTAFKNVHSDDYLNGKKNGLPTAEDLAVSRIVSMRVVVSPTCF